MPRQPRRALDSYRHFHVTAKGVADSSIFHDDHDRIRFQRLLVSVTELWSWRPIAWCLMGTHYHLVVAARQEQMSHALHRLNCLYVMGFNRRHARRGHLFENRFRAWVIRDQPHLAHAIDYVLDNPVRAGLCEHRDDWRWSWSLPAQDLAAAMRWPD